VRGAFPPHVELNPRGMSPRPRSNADTPTAAVIWSEGALAPAKPTSGSHPRRSSGWNGRGRDRQRPPTRAIPQRSRVALPTARRAAAHLGGSRMRSRAAALGCVGRHHAEQEQEGRSCTRGGVGSSSVDSPSHPASSVTALKVSVCLKGFWVVKGPLLLATHFPLLPHHNKTIHTTTTRSPRLDWPFIHQPWCSSPYIHVGGFGWPLERGSGVGGAADTLHHERYNRTQQQRRERNLPLWAESPVVRQHDWVPPCT